MIDYLIDEAPSFLTSTPGIIALLVAGGGIAVAVAGGLAKRLGGISADRGSPRSHHAGREAASPWPSPRTPPAGNASGAVPARRRRRSGIPALVALGAIAAAGGAIRYGAESAELREKAAFDACFEEARKRPVYEVEVTDKDRGKFTIAMYEARGDYLVKTVFGCRVSGKRGLMDSCTISVRDRNMRPIGRPGYRDMIRNSFKLRVDEKLNINMQEFLDDLADGTISLAGHDDDIDRHLRSVREYLEKQKARTADYVRRAGGGG